MFKKIFKFWKYIFIYLTVIDLVFPQSFFERGGTPKIFFHSKKPKENLNFFYSKELQPLKTLTDQKTWRRLVAHWERNRVVTINWQKFLRHFEGYLEIYTACKHFYICIPRFLAEPLTCFTEPCLGNIPLTLSLLHNRYFAKFLYHCGLNLLGAWELIYLCFI